ncbi:hypothetical protein BKA65DRAFT_470928 [Rhexocercosporidium sp. MPI-PUGE-AT-0058]|nr:hypothetical protein BKA65DRAFT_470928 [Rhexocercosporidium sp. MPI-PUGE-AT-0058]
MAELAAVGLVSNIISFIDFSIEFGQLVRDVAQAHGQLPQELEECHEYVKTISSWLANIKNNLVVPTRLGAEEEDANLEAAILRCTDTSNNLIKLLSSLGGAAGVEQGASTARFDKIRDGLRSVKRAGKIVWRKDEIRGIRDKLRENRDDVHACIASRTGMKVGQIREEQREFTEAVRDMRGTFRHAIVRLESLESQNQYLILQNHQLNEKVDFLCDMLAVMQRDRSNRFAEIFEFVPPKIAMSQVMEQLHFAFDSVASRLLRSRSSPSARPNRMQSGPAIYQLSKVPNSKSSDLTIRVITGDGRGMPRRQASPRMLNLAADDVRDDFSLPQAFYRCRGETLFSFKTTTKITFASPRMLDLAADDVRDDFSLPQAFYRCRGETLSSFKATTKITFFRRKGSELSILNFRNSDMLSGLTSGPGIVSSHGRLPNSHQAEATDDVDMINSLGDILEPRMPNSTRRDDPDVVDELPPPENSDTNFSLGSPDNDYNPLPNFQFKDLLVGSPRLGVYDELQRLGREQALRKAPSTNKDNNSEQQEDERGIMIERDWSLEVKILFWICSISATCRVLSYGLEHCGVLHSSSSALAFSLTSTMVVGFFGWMYYLDALSLFLTNPKGTLHPNPSFRSKSFEKLSLGYSRFA